MRLIDADKLLEETIKDRDYAEKNGFLDMYYERQVLIDRIKSQPTAYDVAINALEKQIAKKHDEYVPELDDEIKLPYKISKLEAKAIEVALYHQWFRITDVNGKATSCSQEMADATYKMLCLFDNLIKDSDKEQNK